MATLRQDPTTTEWVIMAPERAERPHMMPPSARPTPDAACPFCPGSEYMTPPEVLRIPRDGPWEIRVVPNRFPALMPDGSTERRGERVARDMDGLGSHEVVIESPRHDDRLDEMSLEHVTHVLTTWRDRSADLRRVPWARAVIVFKNVGMRAGTSVAHPHSQILVTPVLPPDDLRRRAVATRYADDTGHSVYADLLHHELRVGDRVIADRDGFVAITPFASRLPYEAWILPRSLDACFDVLPDQAVSSLAAILREVLGAVREVADDPDYNLVVHSCTDEPGIPWYVRVLPRTATEAGFELGSGMAINSVLPERAAARLRDAVRAAAR